MNMLGIRETDLYGLKTYRDLVKFIRNGAKERKIRVRCVCSDEEGKIVGFIHKAYKKYDGILINAGAYTHTSLAILDALKAVSLPTVEVHITDPDTRESYRRFSYISEYAFACVKGHGYTGYSEGLDLLKSKINEKKGAE